MGYGVITYSLIVLSLTDYAFISVTVEFSHEPSDLLPSYLLLL